MAVADAKLFKQPGSGVAKRIFAAAGDEIMDDDYDLIESNDILYLSCGEDWRAPAAAPPPAAAVPPPEAAAALTSGEDRPPSTPVGPLAEPAASTSPAVAPTTVDASPQAAAVGGGEPAAPESPPAIAIVAAPEVAMGEGAVAMDVDGKEQDGEEADDEMEEGLYEVDEVLARRRLPNSEEEFLVSWKGYSDTANTWEPAANILDPELVSAFESKQAAFLEAMDEHGLRALIARAGLSHADCPGRAELEARAADAQAKLLPQPCGRGKGKASTVWVACDKCAKWRRLPANRRPPLEGEPFECSMNPPELMNNCIMPQETLKESVAGVSVEKLRARMEREAEREAARLRKLAEKQEKEAARAAEKAKKEEERRKAREAREEEPLVESDVHPV